MGALFIKILHRFYIFFSLGKDLSLFRLVFDMDYSME